MRLRALLPTICLCFAAALTGCASTSSTKSDEWDGLVRQPHNRLQAVFVKPDAEIPAYRSVMLDPIDVRFARNFGAGSGGRSQLNRLDAGDMDAIRANVADLFRETLRAELARGGYELVDQAGPDTLRVSAAIVDLYITAPDTMSAGRSRTYTANAGRMTLVAELRDSLTGEILARAVDGRSARTTGTLTWTNRVTNTADARRAMTVWATALRQALDNFYGKAG